MAITRTETQVTWPTAANSITVQASGSTNRTSETITLDATCIAAQIHLKADNSSGTPASDDIIYFWLLQTGGDPDGTGSDEYDDTAPVHALLLAAIDTNLANTTGEIGVVTVPLPIPQAHCQVYAEGETAGITNDIDVSATITEQRAA